MLLALGLSVTDTPCARKRDSDSGKYEIFHPPVSNTEFKELKADVAALTQNVQSVSKQLENLESGGWMHELKQSLSQALQRIDKLEDVLKRGVGNLRVSESKRRHSTCHPDANRDYLRTLTCEQVSNS